MYRIIFVVFMFYAKDMCSNFQNEVLLEKIIPKNKEDRKHNKLDLKVISKASHYERINYKVIDTMVAMNAINLKEFGAIGDGVTDDSAALQLAFDSGENLFADTNSTFLISKLLHLNAPIDQEINWNNSVITSISSLQQTFEVKKKVGRLRMSDLTIDGNDLIAIGFWIHTLVDFDNVDVKRLRSKGIASYAFRYEVTELENSQGNSNFDNCDCYEVHSEGNGKIGDSHGASRCLIFRWGYVGSTSIIKWTNSIFDGAWGDDGDLLHFEQMVSKIYNSRIIFDNMEFKNFSRRGVKGLSGGVEFWNSSFTSTSPSNPKVENTTSAGLMAMGNFFQENAATGLKIIGCTFDNGGYEGRLILNRQDGVEIRDCVFINTDIAFNQKLIGDVDICNNKFIHKCSIYEYGMDGPDPYFGTIRIGDDNKGLEGGIRLPSSIYKIVECK